MVAAMNFDELKQKVTIDQMITMLNLPMRPNLRYEKGQQWRGPCPRCGGTDQRALTLTKDSDRNVFYCQIKRTGGSIVDLAAHVLSVSLPEAGAAIQAHFFGGGTVPTVPRNSSGTVPRAQGFDAVAYAAKLDPAHEALEPLGISPETLKAWKAGYCSTGLNRGRLALPVYDGNGSVVAYIGRAIGTEQPLLKFPSGFDPAAHLFGIHHVTSDEVRLVRDVLDVLRSAEGMEEAICFLTDTWGAQQDELLAGFKDAKKFSTFL